ncbi:MAG TPA: ester cyclase [Acidimicrobiia bacterium]|nr:ester cyclase [Acidimicrobiia bacterium]
MADVAAQARRIVELFNAADWDALSEALPNDTAMIEYGTQRSFQGSGDIVESLQAWKTAMPDVMGSVQGVIATSNQVVLELVWEGTHTGPLAAPGGEIPASGKHHKTPGVWIFDFDGDTLTESRQYFDMLTLLQQIGAA